MAVLISSTQINKNKNNMKLTINGIQREVVANEGESLLDVLRNHGYSSVKYGCGNGTCGVCTVLINGKPVRSCSTKPAEVKDAQIFTLEGLSHDFGIHPLQDAFIETGAIQCGYCTPAQILTAKSLLDTNPDPSDDEIRQALSPVLCRCTGYVRVVAAIKKAAASIRGMHTSEYSHIEMPLPDPLEQIVLPQEYYRKDGKRDPLPPIVFIPKGTQPTNVVGSSEIKVDARKLALGRPVFTDDISLDGMLYGALLTSPHAHAIIRKIDTSKARALEGVQAVLTYKDIPRIKYATGGQSHPQPKPYDQVCLDDKVRHVGDRVAVVAASTSAIAEKALKLIDVEYEILPAVVDPEEAMRPGAPIIHDEADTDGIYDSNRNLVYHIEAEVGNIEKAFSDSDHIFEGEYRTPKQQHAHLEPHVCLTYFDDDDRLVVRTSTQVPFHIRRMLAPLIGLPVKKIRVIKPRIGGGFGNKQEMILEDLCAHLTLITKRPVRMQYTRKQEFTSSRSRHANIIRYKVGVKNTEVIAADLYLIGDTGAYGCHGLTVNMVGGFKGLTLYNPPNARFKCDVVYTNTPPAGAFRGYGAMQCQYGIETLMAEIAEKLGLDEVEFKRRNWIKLGEPMYLSKALGEGREGTEQTLESTGMAHCVDIGLHATNFYEKRKSYQNQEGSTRRGIGMAVVMHGSGIAGLDMAAATIKMNDDGSFNLLIGATDLGTGSDTILGQIAAEVLGVPLEDMIVYSSDTDFTPFDKGAYASSTTYISGGAVKKAALAVKEQIFSHAAMMIKQKTWEGFRLENRQVITPEGKNISLNEIALNSLHQQEQHQIMATASHISPVSPPPTAAQFVEIEVNTETGVIQIQRMLMVVDCGRVINPTTASGQVEGGMSQALGFSLTEEMLFDKKGQPLNPSLAKYQIPHAQDMPATDVMFVLTDEKTGPFGAKSVSEISIDGVAPALASAFHNATGVWVRELPYTPERVKKALNQK